MSIDIGGWITNGGSGYNFHFNHDDWQIIAKRTDDNGDRLVKLGGGLLTVSTGPTGVTTGKGLPLAPGWGFQIPTPIQLPKGGGGASVGQILGSVGTTLGGVGVLAKIVAAVEDSL